MGWLSSEHPLNLDKHTVWMDDTCTARLISGPRTSFRIHGVHLLDYAPFSLSRGEPGGEEFLLLIPLVVLYGYQPSFP